MDKDDQKRTETTVDEQKSKGNQDDQTNLNQDLESGKTGADTKSASDEMGWKAQIPKKLRDKKCFNKFNSMSDLLEAYADLVEHQDESGQTANASSSSKEKEEDSYDRLYESIDGTDEEQKQQKNLLNAFKEAGISAKSVENIIRKFSQSSDKQKDNADTTETNPKTNLDIQLDKMWGNKKDEMRRNFEYAKSSLLNKEELENLERDGLLENPSVVNMLARYGATAEESTPNKPSSITKTKKSDEDIFFPD